MPPFLVRLGRRTVTPLGITLVYAGVGTLWILLSDRILPTFHGGSLSVSQITLLQTLKGLLYVLVTAAMLYGLIRSASNAQRRSQRALEEIRARYDQLFERTAAVVLIICADTGEIIEANPAAVAFYGWSREELITRTLADLTEQTPDQVEAEQAAARAESRDFLFLRHRTRERGIREVAVNYTPITTPRGALEYVLIHDITQLRTLERQLRQAQRMEAVGQLTGGIAHDLNNVLTVVLTSADLLAQDLADRGAVREEIQDLRNAARRGASMIRKLLSFSRSATLSRVPSDLGRLIDELRPMLTRVLPAHITITGGDSGAGVVLVDTMAMEQIVLNLATNARDAMPDGGTLRLETGRTRMEAPALESWMKAGDYAFLRVSDTGHGMDERVQGRVFEPFFTTKSPDQGSGLGMAMIYGLVKQHEGYITVQSRPGSGTTVTIYLRPSSAAVAQPVAPGAAPRSPGGETILLVEDEAALQRAGQRILERLGYRVLVAADGQKALQILEDERGSIQLVISDVVMPHLGGGQLFAAARERGHRVHFLFTSGYAAGVSAEQRLPAAPFLSKPWTYEELARKVREVLAAPLNTLP